MPLSLAVGPGDEHDIKRFREVLDGIKVKHGVGRPRTRPLEAHADSAYDSKRIRAYLRGRGIKANISANPRNRHRRPYGLKEAYKRMRSCVKRFFAWLNADSEGWHEIREAGNYIHSVRTTGMHHDILKIFEMSS